MVRTSLFQGEDMGSTPVEDTLNKYENAYIFQCRDLFGLRNSSSNYVQYKYRYRPKQKFSNHRQRDRFSNPINSIRIFDDRS
jgi:hypothetical protein